MTRRQSWRWFETALDRSWWPVVLGFALLEGRLAYERVFLTQEELLSAFQTRPLLTWLASAAFLAAHVWAASVYVWLVRETGRLLPLPAQAAGVLRPGLLAKSGLMLALVGLEMLPKAVWVAVRQALATVDAVTG